MLKRIQAYKIQRSRHHAYESPKMKTYDAPRHKDNKFRGDSEGRLAKGGVCSNQRKSTKRGQVTDGRTNTDNKGCRILAAGNWKRMIPPSYERKVKQGQRGPATSAEEQPRDDWHHKGCGRDHHLQKLLPSHAS